MLPQLVQQAKPGGVYLGVGPEQNFNYIVALKPKMVFITDIRRGNLHTQLMYKALFEMSRDRADFYRPPVHEDRGPTGLTDTSTAGEIVDAFWDVADAERRERLQEESSGDQGSPDQEPAQAAAVAQRISTGIEYVYYNFYWFGPSSPTTPRPRAGGGAAAAT